MENTNIHDSWKEFLDQYNFENIKWLDDDDVYPPKELRFRVFELDLNEIKVVLLGQDPYQNIEILKMEA